MTEKKKYRSIFISDVHLGTKHSQADKLLEFLKSTDADYYFLVGDIIDGWMMKKKNNWKKSHTEVIQFLIKKSRKPCQIIYIVGNHDDFLRNYTDKQIGNISLVDRHVHYTLNNRKYLLMHGDQFDVIVMNAKWLSKLGGHAYDILISINTMSQWIFRILKIEGFSLSAWIKQSVKGAVNFISNYENVVIQYAKEEGVDGIICGHIHHANIIDYDTEYGPIKYINCGDMVESCTAVVENYDGTFEIKYLLKGDR